MTVRTVARATTIEMTIVIGMLFSLIQSCIGKDPPTCNMVEVEGLYHRLTVIPAWLVSGLSDFDGESLYPNRVLCRVILHKRSYESATFYAKPDPASK
jgi:hypothetical protein